MRENEPQAETEAHLIRVIPMAAGKMRRTPTANLVADIVLGGGEKGEDCE